MTNLPEKTIAAYGAVFTLTGTAAEQPFEAQQSWRVEHASSGKLHGYLHLIAEGDPDPQYGYTDKFDDPMVPEGADWHGLLMERLSSWPAESI